MKILPVLFAAFILAVSGCSKNSQQANKHQENPIADESLRMILGIHTMSVSYSVPKKDKWVVVALLKFKNGELVGRVLGGGFDVSAENPRICPRFLWGKINGEMMMLFRSNSPTGMFDRKVDPFFLDFTGENFVISFPDQKSGGLYPPDYRYHGWKILQYAQTTDLNGIRIHQYVETPAPPGKKPLIAVRDSFPRCLQVCANAAIAGLAPYADSFPRCLQVCAKGKQNAFALAVRGFPTKEAMLKKYWNAK